MNELGSMISNTAFNILFLVSFYIQAVHLVKTFVQSHFQIEKVDVPMFNKKEPCENVERSTFITSMYVLI